VKLERSGFRKKLNLQLCDEVFSRLLVGVKRHSTFCGLNGTSMAFREKYPQRVYSEILELSSQYHRRMLAPADNILDMDYFRRLLPKLEEVDSDIELFYEVKANLKREQVRALSADNRAGSSPSMWCRRRGRSMLLLGIDS
jgi:hypothetical protein